MWFIEATDWVAYLEVGSTLQGFNDPKVRGVVAEEEVQAILAVTHPGCHLRRFSLKPQGVLEPEPEIFKPPTYQSMLLHPQPFLLPVSYKFHNVLFNREGEGVEVHFRPETFALVV